MINAIRDRKPESQQRSPVANVILGLIAIGALVGSVFLAVVAPNGIPGVPYYNVSVELKDAGTVSPHTMVQIAGQPVGQVKNPRTEGGRPVIDLQLRESVAPVLTDARVRVRPRTPVGEPYVELFPGTSGRPLPDGGRLPAAQTSAAVPLDRVLSTFDAATRKNFTGTIGELGQSVAGRGEGLNGTLGAAPGMLRDTASFTTRLGQEGAAIRGFLDNGAATTEALARVKQQLDDGPAPAAKFFQTVAGQRAALEATLDVAPGALAGLRSGLARVEPALENLGEFATAATPALRAAPGALRQANRMLASVPKASDPLDRTLRLAGDAVPTTLTLLRRLTPPLPLVDAALASLKPMFVELAPRRCDIVRMARNWENMFAFKEDKLGHVITLTAITPGVYSLGGFNDPNVTDLPPTYSDAYPAPCDAYHQVTRLAQTAGSK